MTVYECLRGLPDEVYSNLQKTGYLKAHTEYHLKIYEAFGEELENKVPVMQAYVNVSERCCTSDENVRKVVRELSVKVW